MPLVGETFAAVEGDLGTADAVPGLADLAEAPREGEMLLNGDA
jgi:hypothetical protein